MKPEIYKTFKFDNVEIKVKFRFCEKSKKYIGEYPDLEEAPLFTKNGTPIVMALQDKCLNYTAEEESVDCGSCDYFKPNSKGDLIGACTNNERKFGGGKK